MVLEDLKDKDGDIVKYKNVNDNKIRVTNEVW